ncbi:hypothetical protein AB4865_08255 [Capnocytophaga sp. ARDL2]|uniref:hypothetical protein n=1 Tax=Capnocytophaga sp. ARDL2 TaxID=3238809 RepID=UPI003556CC73
MKKIFILLSCITLFVSCKKEMKISRANETILEEIHDFSPIFIDNIKGVAKSNRNNIIGNTHWIITADRDLTLGDITEELIYLTNKKYKDDAMHPDDKNILFIYSDTLKKQNAFVPFHFKKITTENIPLNEHQSLVKINNLDDVQELIFTRQTVIQFSPAIDVETFTNILINLHLNKTFYNYSNYLIIKE